MIKLIFSSCGDSFLVSSYACASPFYVFFFFYRLAYAIYFSCYLNCWYYFTTPFGEGKDNEINLITKPNINQP